MNQTDRTRRFRTKLNSLYLFSRRLVEELLAGSYRSVFRGPGLEFTDLREYDYQDDPRFIDWNVTARLNHPYTRLYREERELILFFVIDVSASLFYAPVLHRRRELEETLVALLSFCAIQNNDRVGALFFSDRIEEWIPPRKWRQHGFRLITALMNHKPKGRGSDLSLALKTVGRNLKKRGIVCILSDFKTGGYGRELSLLAHKHDVIALRLFAKEDEEFPPLGYLRMRDPETGHRLPAFGSFASFRDRYAEFRSFWRRVWVQECSRRGVDRWEVETGEDPVKKLLQFFKKRRKYR